MRDITLEATELNLKVVRKRKRKKERHNFERLEEKEEKVAGEMRKKGYMCVCIVCTWFLWEKDEEKKRTVKHVDV